MKRRVFLNQSFVLLAVTATGSIFSCVDGQKEKGASFVIKQFEDSGLSHFSYAILADKKIILIDPARNPKPYYDYAEENDAKIIAVIETHPHADFVSCHLEIHQQKEAEIYVSKLVKASYPHQTFDEGDSIELSSQLQLKAIHTPGHSPDSISVILEEKGKDIAVFTGDALLFGSVGRPDLREYSGEAVTERENLAKQMYHTIHQKYALLEDEVLVYPAHGAGSLCGNAIRDVKESTIGYEKAHNFAFQQTKEEEFVKQLLSDQPHIPQYFPYDVELNKKGAKVLSDALSSVPVLAAHNVGAKTIVDTRTSAQFRASHFPESINIPDNKKFETWLGTIISPEERFYLVVDKEEDIEKQLSKVAKIGYEVLIAGVVIYGNHQGEQYHEFEEAFLSADSNKYIILDIRTEKESAEDRVFENAVNIPLAELQSKINTLPTDKAIYVHCASGFRSSIGTSLIKKALPDAAIYDIGDKIKQFRK